MSLRFPYLSGQHFEPSHDILQSLENGKFNDILSSSLAKRLLCFKTDVQGSSNAAEHHSWSKSLRAEILSVEYHDAERQEIFLLGLAALQAFLQSNVTGPPLEFDSFQTCFPSIGEIGPDELRRRRKELARDLSVDGEAVYELMPNVELFCLARTILTQPGLCKSADTEAWARIRINFWHQKLLNEAAFGLQEELYKDLTFLEGFILGRDSLYKSETQALYLIERSSIHAFHGFDQKARDDLEYASRLRGFQFVLTGRLGKRTKFQQTDLSQLVVLAKSSEAKMAEDSIPRRQDDNGSHSMDEPKRIDLNDDTLLERISFASANPNGDNSSKGVQKELAELDPSAQPILDPIDAAILLSFATSITNMSPEHGLTREETLPYATRVIDGGSSNWQVYTQALLVRSRIEGHKSRTVERGVLQLQALVDQIIAETSGSSLNSSGDLSSATTFLPRPKPAESASVMERLLYLDLLNTPPRWALEAELASRWASLGGLRTALEIYERLEMWAEASLCLAATDQEGKAIDMVRRQLYNPISGNDTEGYTSETYGGDELMPLPADAPRLFCILADLEQSPDLYERAWQISNCRYGRAQRSLGKYYVGKREFIKADEAYVKSLSSNPQNGATWFALGCVRLETRNWKGAVTAFQRSVHIEQEDGEAWSNLAAALLHIPVDEPAFEKEAGVNDGTMDDSEQPENKSNQSKADPQRHRREAMVAFKRAAKLKHDSYRIWENVLNVAATLIPPPYADIIIAQTRLIELRGKSEGESCVDIEVLEGLLRHIISASSDDPTSKGSAIEDSSRQPAKKHGIERMYSNLITKHVIPLITHSRRLWQLVARLAIHERHPATALDAYEKAWRATLNQPGWDDGSGAATSGGRTPSLSPEQAWKAVQEATEELVDAYESLGERETTEGLAADTGTLVCANWKFKARSAIRSVIGRRTKAGLEDVDALRGRMDELKS